MKDMSENQWRYIEGFYFKNISTQIQMYDNTKVESVQLGQLLKSSIFVLYKAAAPKNWVEFCQRFIGALRGHPMDRVKPKTGQAICLSPLR